MVAILVTLGDEDENGNQIDHSDMKLETGAVILIIPSFRFMGHWVFKKVWFLGALELMGLSAWT